MNNTDTDNERDKNADLQKLVGYIVDKERAWSDYRDTNFADRWDEYYRIWRGIWSAEDKTNNSERSKLITPASAQAIESAVAELEEAFFGTGKWFDIADDFQDPENKDIELLRNLLLEDMDYCNVKRAISEVFLNSALYGTGIGKLITEDVEYAEIVPETAVAGSSVQIPTSRMDTRTKVKLVAVHPKSFAIDPAAKTIDEALGCIHTTIVPKHSVVAKQRSGVYNDVDVGNYSGDACDLHGTNEVIPADTTDMVKIIEYHGLVPKSYLAQPSNEDGEFEDLGVPRELVEAIEDVYEDELVEAIVVIANDEVVLKAEENPLLKRDRGFVAFPFDLIPGRFWGRGIAEKGYNPQKALDAELRGRIDSMALTIHPMMGIDSTKIPRAAQFKAGPGQIFLTQGDPATVLRPFTLGQVSNQTFSQSGELERMIQMGTGAMDSATPVGISPRNNTASGMSMIMSGSIKRSKRTIANIEELFISPLVHKIAWRYMQLDPRRYPIVDVRFKVISSLGIMARELEQQQHAQMLNTVPPDSPAYWMLIKSVYQYSSLSDKESMLELIDQQLQQSLQPKQPNALEQAKMAEIQANIELNQQRIKVEAIRAQAEILRATVDISKTESSTVKQLAESILAIAKAEAEEAGTQMNKYAAQIESLKPRGLPSGRDIKETV